METPQTTLDDVKAELIRLKKDLDVQKEIAALRMEVTLQLSYFKWAAGTAAVVLGVISFFGFRAWTDLTTSARRASDKQLSEMRDRYSNLSRGFSLVDANRKQAALKYLEPLYETDHYDEPVLRSLLFALSGTSECDEELLRVKELKQDQTRFWRIKDPEIYDQISEVLRDCSPYDSQTIEEAQKLCEFALKLSAADDPERGTILYDLFTYAFIQHDLKGAESYLRQAAEVQAGFSDPQQLPTDAAWFKALRERHDPMERELEPLWSRVAKKEKK